MRKRGVSEESEVESDVRLIRPVSGVFGSRDG